MNQSIAKYTLYAVIAALTLMLINQWNAFSKQYDAQLQAEKLARTNQPETPLPAGYPSDSSELAAEIAQQRNSSAEPILPSGSLPATSLPSTSLPATSADLTTSEMPADSTQTIAGSRAVVVQTDTLRVVIDKLGGDITEVALIKHLESLDDNAKPLRLLEKNGLRSYIAQSGLIGDKGSNAQSARAVFSSDSDSYTMQGEQQLDVELVFTASNGVQLRKTFSFKPNDYTIDVNYRIVNQAADPWRGTFYAQIMRDNTADP
ncbi:MAG: membrane protein insertase YidC, partial [Gammaproteobacteria bacterium]|nr:membrane protein insertase YidC [Gammaproteobacteria bacterium]